MDTARTCSRRQGSPFILFTNMAFCHVLERRNTWYSQTLYRGIYHTYISCSLYRTDNNLTSLHITLNHIYGTPSYLSKEYSPVYTYSDPVLRYIPWSLHNMVWSHFMYDNSLRVLTNSAVFLYVCVYVCVYMCVCVCACVCARACVRVCVCSIFFHSVHPCVHV